MGGYKKICGKNVTHFIHERRGVYLKPNNRMARCTKIDVLQVLSSNPNIITKGIKIAKDLTGKRVSFQTFKFNYDDCERVIYYDVKKVNLVDTIHKRIQFDYSDEGEINYYKDLYGNEWKPEWEIKNPFLGWIQSVIKTKFEMSQAINRYNVRAIASNSVEIKGMPENTIL
jgi:hypothetical protein